MKLTERLKAAYQAFSRVGGLELPSSGRSSEETLGSSMSAYLGSFGNVSPIINFEMLQTLKQLWLFNPDVSQYVANIVNLGNPGHQISVDAKSDTVIEAAVTRLNESASRIYTHGVGVDGLLNHYLASVAWSGAVSSEDVVNIAGRRVEKVVIVPVEKIRFRYDPETDTYHPYQQLSTMAARKDLRTEFGMVKLHPETYRYYALATIDNSPYAKPPATAAVQAILDGQVPIMENIQYMAKKIGLLGLVSASVMPPPRKPGETEAEFQSRATTYLKRVRDALQDFSKGLLVTFRDQKIEHTPVTTGAQGVYDLNRMSEEQIFSGLSAMPGFHGRTDATTETFADVVYYLLTAQVANMQRIVTRRQERTYRLDLRLGGIEVDGVSVTFNKSHSRNAKAEAETEAIKLRTVLTKVRSGLITPDEGAQELGLESWADPEMFNEAPEQLPENSKDKTEQRRLRFEFNRASQRYRYRPERIEIATRLNLDGARGNVVPLVKKKAMQA